jgi:ribosomal protein S18 acetylase RimI-like enzyme
MPDYTSGRMAASPARDWLPDHIVRFWRALDLRFGRVEPTWWGAVVTDPRFPEVWDVNYARIDVAADDLSLEEIESVLEPALRDAGVRLEHVVSFHPDATADVLDELVARGHRRTHDLVMEVDGDPPDDGLRRVDELTRDPALWQSVEASLGLFGIDEPIVAQLAAIERDVLVPSGKRWFGIRDQDGIASIGALMLLDEVAYIDNVATFARARARGLASAVTTRIVREATSAGAANICLLADPDDGAVVSLYERLGFREVGRLASTRGPSPGRSSQVSPR